MHRVRLIVAVVIILAVIIAAITILANGFNSALGPSKQVGVQFYSYMEANNMQAIQSLYAGVLFEPSNLQNMSLVLNAVNSRCGLVKSYSLYNWAFDTTYGANGTATVYALSYNVTRANGATKEQIVMIKNTPTAPILIEGYHVTGNCLLGS